jgi:hypothetical protein
MARHPFDPLTTYDDIVAQAIRNRATIDNDRHLTAEQSRCSCGEESPPPSKRSMNCARPVSPGSMPMAAMN